MDGQLTDEQAMERAYELYSDYCTRVGGIHDQPNAAYSGVVEEDGKRYAVLVTGNRFVGVYQVQDDGTLEELESWPKALEKIML